MDFKMNNIIELKNEVTTLNSTLISLVNSILGKEYSILNKSIFIEMLGDDSRLKMGKNNVPFYCSSYNTFFPVDLTALCLLEDETLGIFRKLSSNITLCNEASENSVLSELEQYIFDSIGFNLPLGFSFKANGFYDEETAYEYPFACQELNYYSENISKYDNLVRSQRIVEMVSILKLILSVTKENSPFMNNIDNTVSKDESYSFITSLFLKDVIKYLTDFTTNVEYLIDVFKNSNNYPDNGFDVEKK